MQEPFDPQTGEIKPPDLAPFDISHSTSLAKLADALSKAQSSIRHAEKDAENPHFRASYATLASAINACREPLTTNGIAVIQAPYNTSDGNIGVATMLLHSSGEWLKCRLAVKPARFDAQGAGSVISYLRRYLLMAMTSVASDDDDGEAASRVPAGKFVVRNVPAETDKAEGAAALRKEAKKGQPVVDAATEEMRREFVSIKAAILAAPHMIALDSLKGVTAENMEKIKAKSPEAHAQLVELYHTRGKQLGA